MDVGDDDLFAVFDSESTKSKQVVIPEEEESAKIEKTDSESLVQEICGARTKRQSNDIEEGSGSKKRKTDVDTTLMTGLTDVEVKDKMEADERQVRGEAVGMRACFARRMAGHAGSVASLARLSRGR